MESAATIQTGQHSTRRRTRTPPVDNNLRILPKLFLCPNRDTARGLTSCLCRIAVLFIYFMIVVDLPMQETYYSYSVYGIIFIY